jgi:hypothetical protein
VVDEHHISAVCINCMPILCRMGPDALQYARDNAMGYVQYNDNLSKLLQINTLFPTFKSPQLRRFKMSVFV